ncbi:MAG: GAF domain-containing protein [Thermoflexales bacterium]|nr:GAF domain-containing protein [Thermoflexales bacterium]
MIVLSSLAWLDLAASALSTLVAAALALVVIGAGLGKASNRLFVLFALAVVVWAASHAILVLSMNMQVGNARAWQEWSTISFGFMSPLLLMFTPRYFKRRTLWTDLAGTFGLALVGATTLPTLRPFLIGDVFLDSNSIPTFTLGPWGRAASGLSIAYYLWSLALFWRDRQKGGTLIALGIITLLTGLGIRILLPQIPIMSLTATASVALLGYAVINQQLFNPLKELATDLEGRVAERTQALAEANQQLEQRSLELESTSVKLQQAMQQAERRATQIATGAEIARAATMLQDPDQLIQQVTQLIRERFDLYYVGLFLVDADRRYAILQYGTGEAGRLMKESGHRLEIGGQSMIGWVCANRQARIALDVGEEAVHFANPHLPATRSEMALPLRVGRQVIGALSAQSTREAAFDQSDIAALQGMADQIAVALENARLFQQTQATLGELEETNRLLLREGWQGYLGQAASTRRVEFRPPNKPLTGPLSKPISIPLELRGQQLGRLTLRRETERTWSDEEIELVKSIVLQATLAADNARLVEQSQRALWETEGLYKSAQEIGSATRIEDICQAMVQRAREIIGADRVAMHMVDHDQARVLLSVGDGRLQDELSMSYEDLKKGISGMVFDSRQSINAVDIVAEDGIEAEEARELRRQAGSGALVVVPIIAEGCVIGTVMAINQVEQRQFTQHDVDMLTAMSAQATIAIENQRLIEQSQRRAEHEQLIRQITTRIRAARDIEGILQTTATELAHSVGVPRAIVRLTTGEKQR